MSKKILLLDSSFPLNSRNIRIFEYLRERHDVTAVAWDRLGSCDNELDYYRIFQKKSDYGNKVLKLFNLPEYYRFIKNNVIDFKPDTIIASNWDMLAMAALIKIRYKTNLIYENRDMVSSKNIIIKYLFRFIESLALINTDAMIIASRFFKDHYKNFTRKTVVLENKVSCDTKIVKRTKSDKLRVSFIGTVRFYDILKNLIDALKNDDIFVLNIYGEGPDKSKIEKYVSRNNIKNVKIHGSYDYIEIGKCYAQTDIVWSGYPNTDNSNKKYVIPNKYYESRYFNVPGIFPDETELGELVASQNIGFVVNPYSVQDIQQLLFKISKNKDSLDEKVVNMKFCNDEIIFENDVVEIERLIGG